MLPGHSTPAGTGYLLRADLQAGDLPRMERLLTAARGALRDGKPSRAAICGAEALALWQEPAVLTAMNTEWSRVELTRLTELQLTGLEEYAEAMVATDRSTDLIGVLQAHAHEHPLRERGVRAHMLALARAGRQGEALEVYERTRVLLVEELGVDPGPALQEAHLVVLRQDQIGAAQDLVSTQPVHHLPRHTSPLIGRSGLLARVEDEFARPDSRARIVVLVGLGGVGKSRLAAEIAERAHREPVRGVVGAGPRTANADTFAYRTRCPAWAIHSGESGSGVGSAVASTR